MEPEGSLPLLQETTTSPYTEPEQSSPYIQLPLLEDHFTFMLPFSLYRLSGHLPSGIPTNTLYAPLLSLIHATRPVHLIVL
jgi:hypothetical protein